MFKSIRTKIFLAFAVLSLLQLGILSLFFGRVVVRETETYILDSLSRRSESKALDWAASMGQKTGIVFLSESHALSVDAQIPLEELIRLAPKAGDSLVTPCQSADQKDHLCAFAYVPSAKGWVIDTTPKTTIVQIIRRLTRELTSLGIVLILVALFVTFIISSLLLRPIQRFASATRRVALGNYDELDLPTERADEIGQFASTFQKMLTDLREREKKIAHSTRLASIGQMGASIAHEVKNPLTSMLGYAKILSRKVTDPEAKEAADIIAKEAERCSQILGQMLRFSRSDSGERKPFAIKEVLESALALVKSEAKAAQIEIRSDTKIDSILIGNAQQIQQVVLNVLVNAIHASRNLPDRPQAEAIDVRAFERNGFAVIEIEDHGTGIPARIRDRIFDPFFTTKDKREGTGLGLSVALELVHGHGGGLYFQTLENSGTIFTIELPLPQVKAEQP